MTFSLFTVIVILVVCVIETGYTNDLNVVGRVRIVNAAAALRCCLHAQALQILIPAYSAGGYHTGGGIVLPQGPSSSS